MPEELDDKMTAVIMTVVYFLGDRKELSPGEVKARYQDFYRRAQNPDDAKDAKEKNLKMWKNQ